MNYREEPFEGDELDRMRARQQRKKQGAPSRRSSRRDTPDSVPECRSYSRTPDAPDADFDDLSQNQIEELDLDDYDTYENALEQELNRTIAQSETRAGIFQTGRRPSERYETESCRLRLRKTSQKTPEEKTFLRENPDPGGMLVRRFVSVPSFPG